MDNTYQLHQQLNLTIRKYGAKIRSEIVTAVKSQTKSRSNEPRSRKGNTVSASKALAYKVLIKNGFASALQILWKNAVHIKDIEYGTGRGYIRVGGIVTRGSRFKLSSGKRAKKNERNYIKSAGLLKRKPKPIISQPIDKNVKSFYDEIQQQIADFALSISVKGL